MTFFKCIDGY